MIVLHEPRIIALKAHKVAGTSFEIALSKYASHDSIITPILAEDESIRSRLGFRGPQNYRYRVHELNAISKRDIARAVYDRRLPEKFRNHMSAALAKERLGAAVWDSYTKVAIVRNPFDYMLSFYFWETATEKEQQEINFEEFVLSRPDHLLWNKRIYEIDGIDIVDITIRYDRLKDDVVALEKSHSSLKGLTETFMQLSAKSGYRSRSKSIDEYYADAPRAFDLIYNLCRTEIRKYYFKVPDTTPIRPRRQASWHSKS